MGSGGSKAPTGKLYSQYNNYKSKLNHVGLCTRRSKTNPNASVSSSSSLVQEHIPALNYIEIKEEKVEEIQINDINYMDIVRSSEHCDDQNFFECWEATYEHRQEMLNSMTTFEYIASFPYLFKSDVGFEPVSELN